ncbi:MAG TPA: hypothetical protein PK876_00245 [Elusimicrobiota bacterium]|nr:hypothetical protein [Elusimicrobiota bacterium]
MTLRGFCEKYGYDAGNISRLERGMSKPPQNQELLQEYARNLKIAQGGPDWQIFMDLACAQNGAFPPDIVSDKEVMQRMPVLFRTLRKSKLSRKDLELLMEKLRRA